MESLVTYEMKGQDEMTVTNFEAAGWVWRYTDLTPQVEYLGRVLRRSVEMVAEDRGGGKEWGNLSSALRFTGLWCAGGRWRRRRGRQ